MTATQQRKEFNALHVEADKRTANGHRLYAAGRYDEAAKEYDLAAVLRHLSYIDRDKKRE